MGSIWGTYVWHVGREQCSSRGGPRSSISPNLEVSFSHLQYPEQLLEYVLLPEELLPVPVAGHGDLERVLAVLLVLLVGEEVDDVLEQRCQGSGERRERKARYGNSLTSNRYICRTSDVGVRVHTLESDMFTKAKGRRNPRILFLPFAARERDMLRKWRQ